MALVANDSASVKSLGISDAFDVSYEMNDLSDPHALSDIIQAILNRIFGNSLKLYAWFLANDFFLDRFIYNISPDVHETGFPPKKAFSKFLSLIDNDHQEPFFAWLHLFPPHSYYLPPKPYSGMFNASPELRTFKSQKNELGILFGNEYYGHFGQEMQPAANLFRDRYDEYIRYCDSEFEDFITELAKRDRLHKTIILLSSDHGESFQHNFISHNGPDLYEQLTHVPLIIKEPGQTQGKVINDIVEQVDIPATILKLAGIPVPSWMEGRSLIPLLRGEHLPLHPAFSMNFEGNPSLGHQITKGTIAVWEGDYKLIHYMSDNKSLLFDLKDDPEELNNLFSKEPEISQHLLTSIKDNLRRANERMAEYKENAINDF